MRRLAELYDPLLTQRDLRALSVAIGAHGAHAEELTRDPDIAAIRISRSAAARVLPPLAADYWRQAVQRCPALADSDIPAAVQTAVLSLAYNAGASKVTFLCPILNLRDWGRLATSFRRLGRNSSRGLASRRAQEATLIERCEAPVDEGIG